MVSFYGGMESLYEVLARGGKQQPQAVPMTAPGLRDIGATHQYVRFFFLSVHCFGPFSAAPLRSASN